MRRPLVLSALSPLVRQTLDAMPFTPRQRREAERMWEHVHLPSLAAICLRQGWDAHTLSSQWQRQRLNSVRPRALLNALRLACAAHLIRQGRTMRETAHLLNYSASHAFIRHIRDQTGVSAADWRAVATPEAMLARLAPPTAVTGHPVRCCAACGQAVAA